MYTYTPANSTFDSPITNLLSILCVLLEVLSIAHAKGRKALNISNLALSFVPFSDNAASWAVKGLISKTLHNRHKKEQT